MKCFRGKMNFLFLAVAAGPNTNLGTSNAGLQHLRSLLPGSVWVFQGSISLHPQRAPDLGQMFIPEHFP